MSLKFSMTCVCAAAVLAVAPNVQAGPNPSPGDPNALGTKSEAFRRTLDECTDIVARHLNQAGGGQYVENVYQLLSTCLTNKGFITPPKMQQNAEAR